jgi:hypothetical protein
MFTDRFIKLPTDLFFTKEAEMVGYNESTKAEQVLMRVNPLEITHYRKSIEEDDKKETTLIHLKSGESFHVSLLINEFEELLNNYQK